jgi:molybdenum cofactor biosynthesis enzyme
VRYRHPVATDRRATVRAWIHASHHELHYVCAELVQNGHVLVIARAKFLEVADGCPNPAGGIEG